MGGGGGSGIWSRDHFIAHPLKEEVEMIGLVGLTEDLLMAYLVAIVQPKFLSNGEIPLYNKINEYKSKVVIPVSPDNHL